MLGQCPDVLCLSLSSHNFKKLSYSKHLRRCLVYSTGQEQSREKKEKKYWHDTGSRIEQSVKRKKNGVTCTFIFLLLRAKAVLDFLSLLDKHTVYWSTYSHMHVHMERSVHAPHSFCTCLSKTLLCVYLTTVSRVLWDQRKSSDLLLLSLQKLFISLSAGSPLVFISVASPDMKREGSNLSISVLHLTDRHNNCIPAALSHTIMKFSISYKF